MTTRNIMAEQGTLDILLNGAAVSMNNVPGLPSWVPDFSVTASRPLPGTPNNGACGDRHQVNSVLLRDPRSPLSQASWYALQAMSITPDGQTDDPRIAEMIQIMKQSLVPLEWNVLRVEGALFDRIKHVGKRRSMDGESVVRLDTSWFDLAEYLDLVYPTGEGRSEAFWRTLCANRTPTNDRPPDSFGDQFRETLCKIVCGEAQNSAAAARHSSPSGVLLEALMAQALGISHAVRKTTDADDCFRQLNDGLEQLDRLAGSEPPEKSYFPSRDSIRRFWESSDVRIFSNEGRLLNDAFGQPFEVSYLHVYGGRRLYVTERKYIGLGPEDVDAGDGVWILPGSYVPRVLREQTLEGGIKQYRMVGDTYLHGIMQGEAMEGLGDCFQTIDLV
ncbi:hypothetical protein VTN00DRAFT_5408 [Thermoascus crustaceus]|uniref:uncharacterized protein n=1 Tax=Thermoascus crustaceus TaxID=5088 RepID=UPI0037448FBF